MFLAVQRLAHAADDVTSLPTTPLRSLRVNFLKKNSWDRLTSQAGELNMILTPKQRSAVVHLTTHAGRRR
jgi:hypothetical protein